MDLDGWNRVIRQLGLLDQLLDQLIKGPEVGRTVVVRVTLHLHWVILEGGDLGQKLLVELPESLLFLKDVLAIESHLLSFAI